MEKYNGNKLNRRDFIKSSAVGLAGLSAVNIGSLMSMENRGTAQVVVYKTDDRREGVRQVLETLNFASPKKKKVFIKPNFNTADPTPGSTHNDTLSELVSEMRRAGADKLTLGERSGPPVTKEVMEDKGIFKMASDLDFTVINFEELEEKDWIAFNPEGTHWGNGFSIPRSAVDAEYFVSTCCLKTHAYGGVFTMSLKLAVGLTPKTLMRELHGARDTHMRHMIAEINQGYTPQLIVLDGVEAFVDGGPGTGDKKQANVFVAGTDRVAVDAVGLAILKDLGSNDAIMGTKIFEQEQIKRAVEVGLGVSGPSQIELVGPDRASREYIKSLGTILSEG